MKPTRKFDARNSPVAWFVMLEQARTRHDFQAAARAQQKLRELGVEIRYLGAVGARR
jgi:hypothetical protein